MITEYMVIDQIMQYDDSDQFSCEAASPKNAAKMAMRCWYKKNEWWRFSEHDTEVVVYEYDNDGDNKNKCWRFKVRGYGKKPVYVEATEI